MRGVLVVSFLIVIGCTTTKVDVGSDEGGITNPTTGSGGTAGTTGAGGATGSGGASGRGGGALDGGSPGPIVRTYAYHQISLLTTNPTARSMISANGTKIVYPVAPGTGDLATPNRIFVINPDGTGNVEVDAYKTNCFCNSQVVISGDGQIVASTDSTQVRAAGVDASKKGAVTFDSGEVSDLAISGDGAKVFMIHRRDNAVTGGMPLERGLWTMGADGSGLTQLAGATSVAPLFTVTPDQVFPFSGCGKSLDVSADGRRVVIALQVGGSQYALVNESGGTWRRIKGPVQFVYQVAISSDGSKVAVWTQQPGEMHEISVMSFDGTGSRVITTQSQGSCFATMTLNADGSQLLAADSGMLFSTAGGDPITLHMVTAGDGNGVGAPGSISPWFTMTADAQRFGYYNADAAGMVQLALLQINPASLGASPGVSSPMLSTASIPRDRSLGATVSCKISGGGTLVGAGTAVLLNGIEDRSGSWVNGRLFLRDDGMTGDPVANDGAFTSDGTINAGTGAEVGPRIVRAKAEATAADGRRHATAIDISGLEVK